uniref:Uncharacterized protein n=1 Tax=Anopheles dirus TaxID=7168 RepID=A0A182NZ00_9DIPT
MMNLLGWCVVVFVGTFTLCRAGFVECDLDLEDPNILSRLPAECQNVDEPTKALMLDEAESFKVFHAKLLDYEAIQRPANDNTTPEHHMDMDFRRELYETADLQACNSESNESVEQYLRCLMDKRANMVQMIDEATAELHEVVV